MRNFIITLVSSFLLIGCQKESEFLVGSKWLFGFNNSSYVLEFISEHNARIYEVDNNHNYKGSLKEGTYDYSNGIVRFGENFGVGSGYLIIYNLYYFKTGEINGDIMKVTASEEQIIIHIENGTAQEAESKDMGEYVFSLMKIQ